MFGFAGVDHQVVGAGVLPHNFARVHLFARAQKELAVVFQREQRIRRGFAVFLGNQHAVAAQIGQVYFGVVALKAVVHNARAAGVGQKFVLKPNQRAGRNQVFQAQAVFAFGNHIFQLGCPRAQHRKHGALEFGFNIQNQVFHRFQNLAVFFFINYFRRRYRQFKTFAAHAFNQNRQVQFAAAVHFKFAFAFQLLHPQAHVGLGFFFQAVFQVAAGDKFAFPAGEGAVVNQKIHRHRGRVNRQRRQGF